MVRGLFGDLENYIGRNVKDYCEFLNLGKFEYTRRTASYGNWRVFFTVKDVEILRPVIMRNLDDPYYSDWDLSKASSLDSRHYSRYVEKMALSGTDGHLR
jgi:hypothetical protein